MSENIEERARRFLDYLESRREDRGMMADLRRGLSEATSDRAWPYIAAWCDITNDRLRYIYTTVAAAYAANPEPTDKGNMGYLLRRIAMGTGTGEDALKTFDGRFRRLLSCDTVQELCAHLRGVIKAAAQRGIPVNFVNLFRDLRYWSDAVKRRWAAQYWGGLSKGGDEDNVPVANNG